MRHRRLAALLAVVALMAACTSSEAEPVTPIGGESPTPSPSPSPSPSPTPEDPYAIPDQIDEAYVDLVTNEILAGVSELIAEILRQPVGHTVDAEHGERLAAVASGTQLADLIAQHQRYADTPREDLAFHEPDDFGQLTWDTELILEANDRCIVAIGFYDNRQISAVGPAPDQFTIISLEAVQSVGDGSSINPTPWRLRDVLQMVDPDGEQIPREQWEGLDYSTLDTSCASRESSDDS